MSNRVCPWWLGYLLVSPLRRLLQNPRDLLAPCARAGMTVLEPGPGMGFFTIELARMVGPSGRIVAPDVQPKMIAGLKRRLSKAGLSERVDARTVSPDSLGIGDLSGKVDFVLAFAIVHEMPSSTDFFAQASAATRTGGEMLLAEPSGHVNSEEFNRELAHAAQAGFEVVELPSSERVMRLCCAESISLPPVTWQTTLVVAR